MTGRGDGEPPVQKCEMQNVSAPSPNGESENDRDGPAQTENES